MSFVRTLATLAVGFAAAKGFEAFKKGGGMAGLQERMKDNPTLAGMAEQFDKTVEKLGVPGGAEGVRDAMNRMGDTVAKGSESAMATLGGLMTSLAGAAASGIGAAGGMVDALTGTTAGSAAAEANAKLMIRAMIQAAKADGTIDPEERATIMEHLKGASPEEMAFVQAQFDAPLDPLALAADTGAEARAQVYSAAAMTMRADSAAERAFLATLAQGLGLDAKTLADLHATMGISPGA